MTPDDDLGVEIKETDEPYPYPFVLTDSSIEKLRSRFGFTTDRLLQRLALPPRLNERDTPYCLDALGDCHLHLTIRTEGLRWIVEDVSEQDTSYENRYIYHALHSVLRALEQEVDRLEEVLMWAMATWQDDPVIKGHLAEKEPDSKTH